MPNNEVTCWSFTDRIDLGPPDDHHFDSDEPADCCGARGCYPDRLCGECRLSLGDGCCFMHCTEAGAVVVEGDVMCAKHGTAEVACG